MNDFNLIVFSGLPESNLLHRVDQHHLNARDRNEAQQESLRILETIYSGIPCSAIIIDGIISMYLLELQGESWAVSGNLHYRLSFHSLGNRKELATA